MLGFRQMTFVRDPAMKKTFVAIAIAPGSNLAFADKEAVTVVLNAQSSMTQGMARACSQGHRFLN